MFFHPGEKRGSKIEADLGIVVDDIDNSLIVIQNPRGRIWRVALRGDAPIPVVIGIGGVLNFYLFEPGIFSRGLIEVPMNANIAVHSDPDLKVKTSWRAPDR
jgi:hypothetical protein